MKIKSFSVKKIINFIIAFSFIFQAQFSIAYDFGLPDILKETTGAIKQSLNGGSKQEKGTEATEVNTGATIGGCLLGLGAVFAGKDAIKKLAKGNKQKEKQYLLGAAVAGCALTGKLTNSIYNKISEDAKKKINEDMIKAANTGETISGSDPQNASIKYEISTEEKEYKEVIAGQEKTCKVMRSVVDDQTDKDEPETALIRHCLDVATGKYKPEPISA